MEVVESGLYRIKAVATTERGKGGILNVYVDETFLQQAVQSPHSPSVELSVSPPPKRLHAGQVVTAMLDGEPIPPNQLTVERVDGP